MPRQWPAEGHDDGPGTPVDASDAMYGELDAATEQAENYAQANRLDGYVGDGHPPGGPYCMTGADDIPDA